MPAGRPSKYNKEIQQKADEYLINYEDNDDLIPSVEGLSFYLDIGRTTIYEWAKDEDKSLFRDTLEKINAKQKQILLNKGLSGEFNSNITKLALGNHGMSEKASHEVSGPDGKPIETEFTVKVVHARIDDTE